ncbi:MAG: TonB-dependent receptor [Opitutus sp.]|nr:TonB-dependent receptor [Opitutus sp.]
MLRAVPGRPLTRRLIYLPVKTLLQLAWLFSSFGRLARGGALLAAVVTSAAALAQSAGSITGVVTDKATSGYLVGAEVRVVGTDLATATSREGAFTLSGVPAGNQTLEVSYLGRKTKSVPVAVRAGAATAANIDLGDAEIIYLDPFTVESVREGQSRGINQQRTSNTVMNVISSDAIGNLPDQTVGEALSRVAGVSIVIDGKSAFASIRGSEAKLNSVTLDGSHISSPANDGVFTTSGTETRAVDLSTIPSDMISGIEIIKALPADRDADSFGGLVNLTTRSAFDLPGRSINGRVEYRYNNLRKKDGYAFNLNYSDVVNAARTVGLTATISRANEQYGQNDYEISYFDKSIAPVNTIAGITDQGISEFDQRFRRIETKNLGGNLNLDYRPGGANGSSQFYLKLFHNGSNKDMTRWRLRERGFNTFAAASTDLRATGTEARITRRQDRIFTDRDNDRIAVGGKTKLPDGHLSYEVNYGLADLDATLRRYQFDIAVAATRRGIDFIVDRADPEYPKITLTHRATGSDALFRTQDIALNQIRFQNTFGQDKDLVAKADYEFDQKIGSTPVQWKVGAKFRSKDRKLDGSIDDFAPTGTALPQSTFGGNYEPRNVFQGRVPTFGPFPGLDEVFNYYTQNKASFAVANGDETTIVAISRYSATEDIAAGYAMATTQFGKLQAIGGLRYEQTKVDYTYRPSPASRAKGGSSYGNLFPSVLLNYRFNPNLVLRGAWTSTLSRPDYGDLIPYESALDPEGLTTLDSGALVRVFKGNPNLKAQKSMNFDTALEWYFQPTGMLSIALFKKDITDFIYKGVTRSVQGPIVVALYQNLNGAKQDITGTELTWAQALPMLPGPLSGLGFSVNATFVHGKSEFPTFNVTTSTAGKRTEDFVPAQPKRVYNAQVYWEKYGFTARVAVNYIDEFIREVGGLNGSVHNNDAKRWDAQVSYRITKNLTVFVDGKNLTQETKRWYDNNPRRPEEMEYSGWNGAAGVRFRY